MDLVNLDDIIIGERFRSDPGNVSDLMDSIERIGLLHSIVINDEYHLIAGHRRYLAYKKLGETSIPCRVIDLPEESERIAEMEENTVRIDFTNSEIHAIQKYFHETESRQGDNQYTKELRSESDQSKKPREKTAKATGKSTDTISKITQVMEAESDDPGIQKQIEAIQEKVDDQSVDKSYKKVKELIKPKDDKPDSKFLVKIFVDLIKKQDDKDRIFNDLYEILQYSDGAKILKSSISRYKK